MDKLTPQSIWEEYDKGRRYNESIGLYETVKQNENFFIGKQWERLNAPDFDKPVLNFLKRVVSYQISMIVSDDISANFTLADETEESKFICELLSEEINTIIEKNNIKSMNRDALRDAAVDGDCCIHIYSEVGEREGRIPEVEIKAELLSNTNILFGNPYSSTLQDQPFLIVVQKLFIDDVKKMLPKGEMIESDVSEGEGDKRVTVLTRYFKCGKTVWYTKSTEKAFIKKPTDTKYRLYPLAFMNWERVKDSYHGQAVVTGLIPNQIAVNKLWAMALRQVTATSFPKVFFDRTKITEWTNRVGEAIGVMGDPNTAVATSFKPADLSGRLFDMVERTISYSRDMMGASDAALGNVKPENTSAILAVQKASSAPLELQKLGFYQFVEDYIRVIADVMRADYIGFPKIDIDALNVAVDVGASAYFSEMAQLATMDNLFARGIISDPVIYLEGIPDRYIRNKNKIINDLKNRAPRETPELKPRNHTPLKSKLDNAEIYIDRLYREM
jgi:hypothetical protein